ncbi:MAG: ABC transporter permease subunit [Streptosporangiales bacterium]|nr:ABC transporter permease subunit [Streptosporangiales bacterium]
MHDTTGRTSLALPDAAPRRRSVADRMRANPGTWLAIPFYLIVAVMVVMPLGYLVFAAFQTGSPSDPSSQFTLDNVKAVLGREAYRRVLWNTLRLGAIVTVLSCALGVLFAWFVARTNMPGKRLLEVLLPLPLFLSPFAGGVAWVFLGSKSAGLINVGYRALFDTEKALVNIFSFPGLVFAMVLFMTPYAYLFTLGPLRNMDASLEEASRVHGGSAVRTITRITLPLVLPGVLAALLMAFVLSAEMFSLPGLIGVPADYYTLPYFIYQATNFSPPQWPLAAAGGLLLLAIMAIGVWLQRRATRASERFVTVGGKGPAIVPANVGRWRWLGAGLCWTYLSVAIFLPLLALIVGASMRSFTPSLSLELFTVDNWVRVLTTEKFVQSLTNTLLIAVGGPLLGLVLGFSLTYLWQRLRAPFGKAVETVAMLPVAIPGIVLGVGMVWAYVGTPIYGTLAILVIAYVSRFLPHVLRIFSATLVQIDPVLDEASRVSGAGIVRTLRNITLPLLKHSTLSAWLLLFMMMVRELNVAIMVYSSQTTVLPVMLWSEIEGGQYGGAAVVALVEVTIVAAAFVVARKVLRVDLAKTMSDR